MFKPITILIADDNSHMRNTLKNILDNDSQFEVAGLAGTGEEAIKLASQLKPDLVLLDITMRPISGFATIPPLLKKNPTVKVIGVSLYYENAYSRRLLQLGAHGYISKCDSLEDILDCLHEVAAGKNCLLHSKVA